MDMISKVNEGDPIRIGWANDLVEVANKVLSGVGVNGIIVDSGSARLVNTMRAYPPGAVIPAFNIGGDRLKAGSICVVRRSRIMEIQSEVGRGELGISVNVSAFDLTITGSQEFAVVFSGMEPNPGTDQGPGLQGSVILEGLIWVRGKLEEAWDPADGDEPIYRGLNPVDGETFGYIVQEGLWQIVAEEETALARTDEHWIAIRFGAPRLPMLYQAVEDEEVAEERIKIQMVRQNGTLVTAYNYFFSTLQEP
jgi:hypothetical protein